MPSKSADFELCPDGAHIAVCYRVIDLGTQETTFKGQPTRKHQILIQWELPDERMADGRPFSIGKKYTYSSSQKSNLRKDLESWRGKKFEDWELGEFDIGRLIGVGCMLNVVHDERQDNTYANIASIMRLPKGTTTPTLKNDPICFSLADRPFDREKYESLSDRLKEVIAKAPEYRAAIEGRDPNDVVPPPNGEGDYGGRVYDDLDDPIPFATSSLSVEPGINRKPVIL